MTSALDMQRTRAAALARDLLAYAPPGSVASIFAGGSLARGEVWAASIAGRLDVYSDVDIYVVARHESTVASVKDAAKRLVDPNFDGVRFLRPPDIGVYSEADLRAQPLRPGTIDLAAHHVHLHGDASLAAHLPMMDPSGIPAHEALYLLENRALELSEVAQPGVSEDNGLLLIRSLKARLDIHAAHSIVAGDFAPTLAARRERLESHPIRTLDRKDRHEIAGAYHAAADPGAWITRTDAATEMRSASAALARAWKILAALVLNDPTADAASLLARRCRSGSRRANAREVLRLRRVVNMPAWRALFLAPGLSRLSPRAALRVDALARELARENGDKSSAFAGQQRYIDRLTRDFGFTTGDAAARARAMHRAIS